MTEHVLQEHLRECQEAVGSLGGRCPWCGCARWRALQVDHTRREGTLSLFERICRNPEAYQLICVDCGWVLYQKIWLSKIGEGKRACKRGDSGKEDSDVKDPNANNG